MSTAVLLQHRSSNLFIGQGTQWVARVEDAVTFGTTYEAEVFRHRHNISDAHYYFVEIPDAIARGVDQPFSGDRSIAG